MPSPLADPVKLPCGLVLPNRLSKVRLKPTLSPRNTNDKQQAAMAELMSKTNQPTDSLNDAYTKWSEGGWGSILTGSHKHSRGHRHKHQH